MILYDVFWDTLRKKDMSTYDLIFYHGISANTIHRMKHGEAITTKTINELCFILDCSVSEIIRFDKSE